MDLWVFFRGFMASMTLYINQLGRSELFIKYFIYIKCKLKFNNFSNANFSNHR